MLRTIVVALGAMLALPAAAAKDTPPEVLKRSDKWVADYDRDGCHLYAQFGTGDALVVARFTRYEPSDTFDFSVYGSRFGSGWLRKDGKLDFGLTAKPIEREALTGTAGTFKMAIFNGVRIDGGDWKTVEPIAPAQEAQVTAVTVAMRGERPVRLDFDGSLAKPMAQMRKCMDVLVKSWGFDPAQQAVLTRHAEPIGDRARWLGPDDYPKAALAAGNNGVVQFRLNVDTEGKPVDCHVLARTSPDAFADTTCKVLMRRARFTPALDAAGKPIASFHVGKVLWTAGG